MKLPSGSRTAGRQDRLERARRERAAAQVLAAVFPAVLHVRLELQFEDGARTPAAQLHVLHPAAQAYFTFPCPFNDCDGQYDLTAMVTAAVTSVDHQAHGMLECLGLRPRGHESRQPCGLHLHYRISAAQGRQP